MAIDVESEDIFIGDSVLEAGLKLDKNIRIRFFILYELDIQQYIRTKDMCRLIHSRGKYNGCIFKRLY